MHIKFNQKTALLWLLFWMFFSIGCQSSSPQQFETVETALEHAQKHNRRVMVYFTAQWCETCHHLEAKFKRPEIQKLLSKDNIVFIDGTEMTEAIEKKMAHYKVDTFPALILMTSKGQETARLEDDVSIEELTSFLKRE